MGKNQSASGLTNIIQYDNNGNVSFVSGSTTLMQISSSGAITTTGVISGSNALSSSYSLNSGLLNGTGSVGFATTASLLTVSSSQQQISASQQQLSSSFLILTASFTALSSSYTALSGSYTTFSGSNSEILTAVSSSNQQLSASYTALSGSYNTFSGSASTRVTQIEQVYATTGSNSFRATQSITGSLTVTGQIIAQTLNVQQVTSSIIYSSGSNNFGCDLNSRQTFTGSVLITGSLTIAGASSATSYSGTTIFGSTIACSPIGCFATSCATSFIGGTMSGTTIYGSTAVCSANGLLIGNGGVTATCNYLPKFTGASTIGDSAFYDGGGFGGFNSTGLGSRTFVINAANARPLVLEMIEYANVHAVYVRPNNSSYNLISSNYISGGVYLPLALSGRENNTDLVLTTSGNVEIGNSAVANLYKLDVNGTGRFSLASTGSGAVLNIGNVGSGVFGGLAITDGGTYPMKIWGSELQFLTGNSTFGSATTRLTIASTGAATFACSVTAAAESEFKGTSVNTRILITASGVANTVIGFNNSGATTTGVINNAAYVGVLHAYPLIFTTSEVERFRIASTGAATFACSVGIGVSPSFPLEISSATGNQLKMSTNDATSANNAGIFFYNESSATSSTRRSYMLLDPNGANASGGDYAYFDMYGSGTVRVMNQLTSGVLALGVGGTNIINITGSNVGISTSSPCFKFHILGSSQVTSYFQTSGTYAPISWTGDDGTTKGGVIAHNGFIGIGLLNSGGTGVNSSQSITIANSGSNVGIGTNSPASQATGATTGILDVSAATGGNLVLHRTSGGDTALFSILKANNGTYIDSTGAATAANNSIYFRTNNINADQTSLTTALTISSTGITTITGPDGVLVLQAATANKSLYVEYKNSVATRRGYMGFGGDSSSLFEISNSENGAIDFRTNANFAMRIASGGDVTIKGSNHCIYTNSSATISFDINSTRGRFYQALTVDGTVTKGGGSFKIDHPLESKKDTYNLYHSFVESPKADLIYRGKVALTDGYATVNIDTAADMSEGTFEVLVKDVQCFTTNENGWNFVKGTISGNILTIESDNTSCNDEISWMVIGERNDKWFRESTMVDENGKTIVEKLKSETT